MTRANFYMYTGVGQGTRKKSRPFPARAYTTLVVLVRKFFWFSIILKIPCYFSVNIQTWGIVLYMFYLSINMLKIYQIKCEAFYLKIRWMIHIFVAGFLTYMMKIQRCWKVQMEKKRQTHTKILIIVYFKDNNEKIDILNNLENGSSMLS